VPPQLLHRARDSPARHFCGDESLRGAQDDEVPEGELPGSSRPARRRHEAGPDQAADGAPGQAEQLLDLADAVGVHGGRAREELAQRRIVEEIIDSFELYRYRNDPVGGLPYGVQKLVGVARALALEPKLLLLDEPSTGLMREEKESFARFLLRIRHELKLSMLWVEHDMQMVTDLADRIVVLNQGEVIANGLPDQVRMLPEVIKAYLGADAVVG